MGSYTATSNRGLGAQVVAVLTAPSGNGDSVELHARLQAELPALKRLAGVHGSEEESTDTAEAAGSGAGEATEDSGGGKDGTASRVGTVPVATSAAGVQDELTGADE